jgi:hypothetical protein
LKAVIYHADARFENGNDVGDVYQRLFRRFRDNCHAFGMQVIHLSLRGHPGWGDENLYYEGNPEHIVANREECFSAFLEAAPDDVYWFTEPDTVIYQMWPRLKTDCAMLYRAGDAVAMCPAWRMARPSALPFFIALRDAMRADSRKDWHGDSAAFTHVWKKMERPEIGITNYLGVEIEFRDYADYVKSRGTYTRNYLGPHGKKKLLEVYGDR